jgi:hypothetical protein
VLYQSFLLNSQFPSTPLCSTARVASLQIAHTGFIHWPRITNAQAPIGVLSGATSLDAAFETIGLDCDHRMVSVSNCVSVAANLPLSGPAWRGPDVVVQCRTLLEIALGQRCRWYSRSGCVSGDGQEGGEGNRRHCFFGPLAETNDVEIGPYVGREQTVQGQGDIRGC